MKQETDIVYPYVVFKSNGNTYAINSKNIAAITQLPDYEPIPEAPPYITGLFFFREQAVPMLDLRSVFGKPTLQDEYNIFKDMLEARKNDHIHWVKELERSVENSTSFTLATDPHQCAFGKWYDQYESESHQVNFHLKKIDGPHKNLHQAALDVILCEQKCDLCERAECAKHALRRAKEEYMPTVIKLLEEAKSIFEDTVYHEMVLVIQDITTVGIVVDEVLSVEDLEQISDHTVLDQFQESKYVKGVYKSKTSSNLILGLDDTNLQNITRGLSLS